MPEKIKNRIIIGGSGSTGSSLLKNILNRHPLIYAGVETSLFCKRELFLDWNGNKDRLNTRGLFGLRNHGWHIYNGTDLYNNEYGYSIEEISLMKSKSRTLQEFADAYFGLKMREEGKQNWCEKTPANSYLFDAFLNQFERAKCIHMVRNPYDTIASLMARGFNVYYAVGIYLLNTSAALKVRDSEQYHEVKYEMLTTDPVKELKRLYKFLDVPFHEDSIEKTKPEIETTQLKGWNYDETEAIGKKSIGRFDSLEPSKRHYLQNAVDQIRVSKKGKAYFYIEITSIKEICEILNYEYQMAPDKVKSNLNMHLWRDAFRRTARGYATGIMNCPLEINRV